ncbi:MAG: 2Fe-2S iron-sulfur cluster-binding protein [Gammaproteobacteria bacterium]|nr:2Fe-2S iron-sulfur cluster-binding protein [Gammaproteobacteria bacterium]MCZ6585772.1 2Fe-2S iron-sulfur cluster-binding protein [Gammaproteobacteria bacterium]
MPTVVYVQPDGTREEIQVPVGYSVMEGATMNGVAGIEAECGGACSCATCHAYIDPAWADRLPEMEDIEDAMLDSANERRETSRLTCQISVTEELDGLTVTVVPPY